MSGYAEKKMLDTEEGVRVELTRHSASRLQRRPPRPHDPALQLPDVDATRLRSNLTARIAGCWARPAAGSGVWVAWRSHLEFESVADANTSDPRNGWARVQAGIDGGHDGVSVRLADGFERRPLLVLTSRACTSRQHGIGTCLPHAVEVRAGWHDLPCTCNASWLQINCAG